MKLQLIKNLAIAGFVAGYAFNSAFADDAVIKKSLTFHYDKYPQSSYSKEVAVVNWNSIEGISRLERTKFKGDFYRLAHHFKPQINPAACGQGAATVVLSAIYELNHKPFPVIEEWPVTIADKKYPLQYRLFNETNFFNHKTDEILDRRAISMKVTKEDGSFGGGIDIDELQKMLKVHGVKSKLVNVEKFSDEKLEDFRKLVKEVVNSDKEFLLLNYDHSYKGLMGGHFSPLAAYDEKSDSVLMLDVAAHRNPWIWINLSDIYHAMNTKNYAQTSYRGYLIVKTKL
ncbi:MAG: phytochelatin synthase family protein [Rickettsiales bacterium]|nr:phytochelatin synthase family protein [Rickettsiales bacterium]